MASALSSLEALPNEIILYILLFLDPRNISKLQRLSRRLLSVCRDNVFWRDQCFDEIYPETHAHSALQPPSEGRSLERVRLAANWDPTFPGERTNWYTEYIQRNGPVTVNWLEQPSVRDGSYKDAVDVLGVATYQPGENVPELFAVSPLENGSVCLWDVNGTRRRKGSILSTSQPGLLDLEPTSEAMNAIRVTECVSVDSIRNRAYFSVGRRLTEVDIGTLQVVSNTPFEGTITALSAAEPAVPMTVGTLYGIHLHDWRNAPADRRDHDDRVDCSLQLGRLNPWGRQRRSPHAALTRPSPLSILHLEQPRTKNISDDIFVAGRFTSILHYDRRMFPAMRQPIHSGASLCGLASLPYPFSCIDSELRRRGELSLEQVRKSKELPQGRTLIACGEYNTKGSLELYGIKGQSYPDNTSDVLPHSTMKNRQTAAGSKLLSVVAHGTRIVFSDGQGNIKWVERDGFTEVRRHSIGSADKADRPSLFSSTSSSDDIARKLLSTRTSNEGCEGNANNDDILFWTGDKLGLVNFTGKTFSTGDFEEERTMTPEEVAREKQEEELSQAMRTMLEQDANETRFIRLFGPGISRTM